MAAKDTETGFQNQNSRFPLGRHGDNPQATWRETN